MNSEFASEEPPLVGIAGTSDRRAVVNVTDLARQETTMTRAMEEQPTPPFIPIPYNLPVPRSPISEMPNETEQPDADIPNGNLGHESSATTKPLQRAPEILGPLTPVPVSMASFPAVAYNFWLPPDAGGAVGPNHIVSIHNGTMRIHNKSGGTVNTVTLDFFWSAVRTESAGYTFDPKILWDFQSGRWIVTACDDIRLVTSGLLVGVSQSSDPTGLWNLYKVVVGPVLIDPRYPWGPRIYLWADYPSIGFNSEWIVVQVNMINVNNFDRSHVYVFNKAGLLAGDVGNFSVFSLIGMGATQVPAIGSSSTETMYFLQEWNGNSNGNGYLRIYALGYIFILGGGRRLQLTPGRFVSIPSTWDPAPPGGFGVNFGPQLESTARINLRDSRISNVVCRIGIESDYLFAVHTVFLPAGGSATRSASQFCVVRTDGSIDQFARIDDPTGATCYAYPSIAVTVLNSVLIGFSSFSASQYPSANWAFRWGSDPNGTLQMGGVLKSGEGPYENNDNDGRNRWGDYSSTCLDPDTSNGSMIWTIQEYSLPPVGVGDGSGRWGTWWGKFAFSEVG